MFKVFISASSLERLCIDEMSLPSKEQSSWFVLLTKQDVIYLDKDICRDWNCEDPLFMFSQSYEISFKEATEDFNKDLAANPQNILKHPHDAFLLDLDQTKTDAIQSQYGVVCQSTKDLSCCIVSETGCHFSLNKDEVAHTWSELFADKERVPANSLIIIDRYIFGYEGNYRSGYRDGVNNIKKILSSALPNNVNCDFHVLVLFDAKSSTDRYFNLDTVAKELEDYRVNVLKRPYPIYIELFSVSSKNLQYDETHNRRIISNYYVVTADHLLKAFRRDGSAITTQKLSLDYSFSEGLRDRSDLPQKGIDYMVSKLKALFSSACADIINGEIHSCEYAYYINGQQDTLAHLKNRLILI